MVGVVVSTPMRAATPEVQQARNHVILLENFVDELRRKVPLSDK